MSADPLPSLSKAIRVPSFDVTFCMMFLLVYAWLSHNLGGIEYGDSGECERSPHYLILVYVRSKSCSQYLPSFDFSHRATILFLSALNVPIKRCEKPGVSLHCFHSFPSKLIWYILDTPRSSEYRSAYVSAESSRPITWIA